MLDMFVELLLLNLGAFAVGVGISGLIWGRRGRGRG